MTSTATYPKHKSSTAWQMMPGLFHCISRAQVRFASEANPSQLGEGNDHKEAGR